MDWNDPSKQTTVGLVASILTGIAVGIRWLFKRDEQSPVKAEATIDGKRLVIEIPVEKVLEKQDQVLAGIVKSLELLSKSVVEVKVQLDRSTPWAESVERRFEKHERRISTLEGRVRFYHKDDD